MALSKDYMKGEAVIFLLQHQRRGGSIKKKLGFGVWFLGFLLFLFTKCIVLPFKI